MIGYVTLGTNNIERAAKFYDALLGDMGGKRFMESDAFIAWSCKPGTPGICVIKPYDQKNATVGNGVMVALVVDSPEKVNALHKKALALGATDEGAAGPRSEGFYAGYFRDLDGNKLNFYCMNQR